MTVPYQDLQTIDYILPTIINNTEVGDIVIKARYEYTSPEVAEEFTKYMQKIADIYNKPTPPGLTADDYGQVQAALTVLYRIGINGVETNGRVSYLNTEMAGSLDVLARTFLAAGHVEDSRWQLGPLTGTYDSGVLQDDYLQLVSHYTANASIIGNVTAINTWKDQSNLSSTISQALAVALASPANNRTLQAMIELDYIKGANDLIETKLEGLQNALSTTKGILDVLAAVQDLRNQVKITSKPPFGFSWYSDYGNGQDYVNAYRASASTYFGEAVQVFVPDGLTTYSHVVGSVISDDTTFSAKGLQLIADIQKYRDSLTTQINALAAILTPEQQAATGSLYTTLVTVRDGIPDFRNLAIPEPGKDNSAKEQALIRWLTDNHNSTTNASAAGKLQDQLTKAITAAQSLNDTQKEEVRNFLFIFEEYYKSASSVLQAITQILQRMAQGIRNS